MNIGTITRTADDDYPVAVDFSDVDVFATNNVTAATLSASDPTGLTLGTATIASNVATFRVSGGVAGTLYNVQITAVNTASPVNTICRSFSIQTEPC